MTRTARMMLPTGEFRENYTRARNRLPRALARQGVTPKNHCDSNAYHAAETLAESAT